MTSSGSGEIPNTQASPLTWRELGLHAVLLALLLLPLFPRTFLHGEVIYPGGLLFRDDPWRRYMPEGATIPQNDQTLDFTAGWNPLYRLVEMAFDLGEWPLWNPTMHCGMPLLANYQVAVFYPPRVLFEWMDHYLAVTFFIILRVWLCGATAYLCGRVIGLDSGPARVLSVGWMLSGYILHWLYWSVADVAAWFPLLFMGTELVLQATRRGDGRYLRGFAGLLVGAILILFAGHPESALGFVIGLGAYFALRLVIDHDWKARFLARTGVMAAAWGLAIAATTVQTLPFLEDVYQAETFQERSGGDWKTRLMPTVPGQAVVAFWTPRFFGATEDLNAWHLTRESPFERGTTIPLNSNFVGLLYPGIGVWLAAACLLNRRETTPLNRRRLIAVSVPCLVGVLMAFDHPLLGFVDHVPILNTMHRLYFLCFPVFALPLLGSLGLQEWFSRPRTWRDLLWPGLALAAIGVIVLASLGIYWGAMKTAGVAQYVLVQVGLTALFGLSGLAVLALYCKYRRPRAWALAFAAVLALDLLVAARGLLPTMLRAHTDVQNRLFSFIAGLDRPCRFSLDLSHIMVGPLPDQGVQNIEGYDALVPERIFRFKSVCNRCAWDKMEPVLALDYYLVREGAFGEGSEKFARVARLDGFDVFRNRRAFPRAFLVGRLEAVPDADALFARLCDPDYDPARAAVTEAPPAGPLPEGGDGEPGRATVAEYTFNRVVVQAEANAPCVLVLADGYYPGWKAWLDDAPAEIFPVYYALRGVLLPPGRHSVTYRYEPMSFRFGMGVTLFTLVTAAGVALWQLIRKRPLRTSRQ